MSKSRLETIKTKVDGFAEVLYGNNSVPYLSVCDNVEACLPLVITTIEDNEKIIKNIDNWNESDYDLFIAVNLNNFINKYR